MVAESARDRIVAALMGETAGWPNFISLNPELKEHMLALGVMITRYNALEYTIFLFVFCFLNSPIPAVPATVFTRLNNQQRIELLSKYVEFEPDLAVRERLEGFLSAYSICTENRNFLAHAQVHNPTRTLADLGNPGWRGQMVLKKPPKSDPLRQNFASLELSDLRQIADDMERINRFGTDLYLFITARRIGGYFTFGDGKKYAPALPDMPPAPRALILQDSPSPAVDKP